MAVQTAVQTVVHSVDAKAVDWVGRLVVPLVETMAASSGMRWVECLAARKAALWAAQSENWRAVPLVGEMVEQWADQMVVSTAERTAETSETQWADC